jgi:hypothetical protein
VAAGHRTACEIRNVRFGLFIASDSSGAFALVLRQDEPTPNVPGLRLQAVSGHDTEDEALAAMVQLERHLRTRSRR